MALLYITCSMRGYFGTKYMKKGPYNALNQYPEKNVLNESFAHLKAVNIF